MLAYLNGDLVDEDTAGISLVDHGLTVGDGVFETIAVRRGTALACSRHLDRLLRSASGLGLPAPDLPTLHRAVAGTVAANPGISHGAVRVTYTSGPGPIGSARGADRTTTVVTVRELDPIAPVVDVVTVPWPRNERGALAGLKTTSYGENVRALAEARRRGAGEALFANTRGNLCEGSGSNIFVVLGERLLTPPLSAGCLAGITRGLIIESTGFEVDQRDLPWEALMEADEAFLTSTIRDVQPIARVDGRRLVSTPGPVTQAVSQAYAALLADNPDPVAIG
jgi:branched-chain amino acid aminotransferase